MPEKVKAPERERRDWTIILIILLLGFLCVILAGEQALRFSPNWKLNTSMDSNINPDSIFLTSRPNNFFEPLDPSILTPPAWLDVFLTPGAEFNTHTPAPTPISTIPNTPPPATITAIPATKVLPTNTPIIVVSPTRTPLFLPPSTSTFTPIPSQNADLQITKTDGSATYVAGGTTTYTIVVSNPSGPSNVTGATVTDIFPTQISSATWTCSSTGGATCLANGTGNISTTVNLPVGSSVTYTVNASISPAATVDLVNTATVTLPVGVTDPNTGNNSAKDTDTPSLNADLSIIKTDPSGLTTYSPGELKFYTITVSNAGPAAVVGATVIDNFPSQVTNVSWICVPVGTSCPSIAGSSNINDTVNLPAGSSVTYFVAVTVVLNPSNDMVNTATVTAPVGINDSNPGNNTSTYTHIPDIDLQITKDDGNTTYTAGGSTIYTVTVTNNSTFDLSGVKIADNIPSLISSWTWVCASQNGGANGCDGATSNSSNFTDIVNLPKNGSSIVYTVTANIRSEAAGSLINTATVEAPTGYIDAVPGNNSATDIDASTSGEPDIGGPDGSSFDVPHPTSITIVFGPGIVANGDIGTPDFVYYEIPSTATEVDMDWVQIEISSDGATWYTVFYWGGIPPTPSDDNTNMSLSLVGDICQVSGVPTEVDNCRLPFARLYNNTGVTIDIDTIVPGGVSYSWMKISSPPGASESANVDAIQPYYP